MKIFTIIALLFLIQYTHSTFAGEYVDNDNDGLYCMLEDDGLYCNEDDQDKCDGIPNVSIDDDHCSVDLNNDGKFTLDDIAYIKSLYPGDNGDHLLAGLGDYNNFNAVYNRDYDFYIRFNMAVPTYHARFGGHICWFPMRVMEYNRRLAAVNLQPLQLNEPFIIVPYGPNHGCIRDFTIRHVYPVIN